MNTWLQIWRAVVDLFKAPYKVMLAVFLLSAGALVLPASQANQMQIGDWLRSHRSMEWGGLSLRVFT